MRIPVSVAVVSMLLGAPANAQEAKTIQGEAILAHPAGKLALKCAELFHTGKIDDGMRLRTKEEQADWKAASAGEREDMGARLKARAPEPKAFAEAIRKAGVLKVRADGADLTVSMAKGDTAVAYFAVEGGAWRISGGPLVIPGQEEPVNEKRAGRGHPSTQSGISRCAMLTPFRPARWTTP
jgi:hypothetical protein